MAISIKSVEADRLIRELAELTGESFTDAVVVSVRERLDRERLPTARRAERLLAISARARALPVAGPLLGDDDLYDAHGLPR